MRYRISEVKIDATEYADREHRMQYLRRALERRLRSKFGKRFTTGKPLPDRRKSSSEDQLKTERIEIIRESIDARKKPDVKAVYTLDFDCDQELPLPEGAEYGYNSSITVWDGSGNVRSGAADGSGNVRSGAADGTGARPVIAGFGPCGIFAALTLAEAGLAPIVLERGQRVDQRMRDVERFWEEGVLDPESNVQFGEGGAGTFSDGKLTTGIRDRRIRSVLKTFVRAGADPRILYQQRPHIGTDRLREIIPRIRRRIEALGGEVRFGTRLAGLEMKDGRLTAVLAETQEKTESGPDALTGQAAADSDAGCAKAGRNSARIPADHLILAIGHSARDTFEMLQDLRLPMEQKSFSIGVRIEHPQEVIDEAQYGDAALAETFGPAVYKLHHRCENGRGVYTFCMCPGGRVINASSEEGGAVTNGMSESARNSGTANSGLLVDVRPSDFDSEDPLAGVAFQRRYERLAFREGKRFTGGLPKTTWGAFRDGAFRDADREADCAEASEALAGAPGGSGDTAADHTDSVRKCLPAFAGEAIAEAMPHLGRRLKGFDAEDAVMTAVETRSSSPVRILRDETMQCGIRGVIPAGEGPGYAGGIMSAAVDGIKAAEQIIQKGKKHDDIDTDQ